MTSSNLTEQSFALHVITQIFRKAYSAAKSVNGAHERAQEKTHDMRRGIKSCRDNFISTEAIIYITSIKRNLTWAEAELRHNNKSNEELKKTRSAIYDNIELRNEARKFDRTDHGGQKFVTSSTVGPRVEFLFCDGRNLIIDLTEMMNHKRFRNLYPELVAEGQKQFIKTTEAGDISEVEMARVVSGRISETTRWDKKLVLQAVALRSSSDKTLLYTHLHLLPGGLRNAARIINKAHDKVSVQNILQAIQIVIEYLDEQ